MKILIVEDSKLNRVFLARGLSQCGHEVIEAEDGAQGVASFESDRPDLVLMDLMMPVMDGYTATKRIKELSGEEFTPVIVLTALTDTDSLVKAIDYGADDYLTKPYNIDEIHAKIAALSRIKSLHETINKNRNELLHNKEKMDEDLVVAEHIYKSVLNLGGAESSFINQRNFGNSLFSGEILMCSHTPSGDIHLLMGKFSGKGLSAAIGAIPMSEIFYGLTEKGFSIADIAHELNLKLGTVLPDSMISKTCFLEIDKNRTSVGVWNSGMPDVVIRNANEKSILHCPANKKALGTVTEADFDRHLDIFQISGDEKIYLCNSDMFELLSDDEGDFESSKYHEIHTSLPFNNISLDTMISSVASCADIELTDSGASLVEIMLDKTMDTWSADEGKLKQQYVPASIWSANLELDASCLKVLNPVPTLLDIIMNIQAPRGHKEKIFMVLTELFSNAHEHGLLGLDSSLKNSPEGFSEYYNEREKRLANLEEGNISIFIQHRPINSGGEFTIVVKDSGPGFDKNKSTAKMDENLGFSGRGMSLVRNICNDITYNSKGNQVTAVYSWE